MVPGTREDTAISLPHCSRLVQTRSARGCPPSERRLEGGGPGRQLRTCDFEVSREIKVFLEHPSFHSDSEPRRRPHESPGGSRSASGRGWPPLTVTLGSSFALVGLSPWSVLGKTSGCGGWRTQQSLWGPSPPLLPRDGGRADGRGRQTAGLGRRVLLGVVNSFSGGRGGAVFCLPMPVLSPHWGSAVLGVGAPSSLCLPRPTGVPASNESLRCSPRLEVGAGEAKVLCGSALEQRPGGRGE